MDCLKTLQEMDLQSPPSWRMLIPTAPSLFVSWILLLFRRQLIQAQKLLRYYKALYPGTHWKSIDSRSDLSLAARLLMHTTQPLTSEAKFETETSFSSFLTHTEKVTFLRDRTWVEIKSWYENFLGEPAENLKRKTGEVGVTGPNSTGSSRHSLFTPIAHLQLAIFFAAQPSAHKQCWKIALAAYLRSSCMTFSSPSLGSTDLQASVLRERATELCQRLAVLVTRPHSAFPSCIQKLFFEHLAKWSAPMGAAVAGVYARSSAFHHAWQEALHYFGLYTHNLSWPLTRRSETVSRHLVPLYVLRSCLHHERWSEAIFVYKKALQMIDSSHASLSVPLLPNTRKGESEGQERGGKGVASPAGQWLTRGLLMGLLRASIRTSRLYSRPALSLDPSFPDPNLLSFSPLHASELHLSKIMAQLYHAIHFPSEEESALFHTCFPASTSTHRTPQNPFPPSISPSSASLPSETKCKSTSTTGFVINTRDQFSFAISLKKKKQALLHTKPHANSPFSFLFLIVQ